MSGQLVFGVLVIGDAEIAIPAAVLQEVIDRPDRIIRQGPFPDCVLGTFNLRGMAIPAVDLRKLIGGSDEAAPTGKIVILKTAKGRLGLAVDDIADVVRVREADLHRVGGGDDGARPPLLASLIVERNGERIIQVLDIDVLIARPGVMLVEGARASHPGAAQRGWKQYLLFDCDGLRFCLEATAVREVIDAPRLDRTYSLGEVYRGFLKLRGRAIAVFDLFKLLAFPEAGSPKTKLLVLDVGGHVAALLISEVVDIRRISAEHVLALPGFGLRRPDMFDGVVAGGTAGKDAILLGHEALMRDPDVVALRKVHDGLGDKERRHETRWSSGARAAYFGFRAGEAFTAALSQVQELLPMPSRYLPLGASGGTVLGVIERRGAMVPLLDFRHLAGQPAKQPDEDTRVLLVEGPRSRFAFIVDGIDTVEHVFIREELEATAFRGAGDGPVRAATKRFLVDGVGTEGQYVKTVVDLVDLAGHLERLSEAA